MIRLTRLFTEFTESEKSGGIVLIIVTIISIILANSAIAENYIAFWHQPVGSHSLSHWINDGLMAIFFLLIGLELEREVYIGELSSIRNAVLPVFAAIGGMLVPAGIFLLLNYGTPNQSGAGIPMATDIAFAIGVLSLLGSKVPVSLKVFLTALAVIDDLGAILVIAIFYTNNISWYHLGVSLGIFVILLALNRLKVRNLIPYLLGGVIMWYYMLQSGVHATITGVLVAFAIPFGSGGKKSTSYILQDFLHKPVAFFILPLFAAANTCIPITNNLGNALSENSSLGIILGLIAGKPMGILLLSALGVLLKLCSLPGDLKWKHIVSVGFLAGIGFTMSIFITLLAYSNEQIINNSKIAILVASLLAGLTGYILLNITLPATKKLKHEN